MNHAIIAPASDEFGFALSTRPPAVAAFNWPVSFCGTDGLPWFRSPLVKTEVIASTTFLIVMF